MENYFQMNFSRNQINEMSSVALAHIGDGVYELLVRAFLCSKGDRTIHTLHRDTVELVNASAQARFAERLLPMLTEEEQAYFRRGKNAHTRAAPKSTTPREYALATGLESLFGALYLQGKTDRLCQLFDWMIMEREI